MDDERWLERLLEACRRATSAIDNASGDNDELVLDLELLGSNVEQRLERVRAERG